MAFESAPEARYAALTVGTQLQTNVGTQFQGGLALQPVAGGSVTASLDFKR